MAPGVPANSAIGPTLIIWCTTGVSARRAPAIRATRGDHTPQQMTTFSHRISPAVVTIPRTRPPDTVTSVTSTPDATVSAPAACACSRISVPARSESTTPTVGKYPPPRITDSSRYGTSFPTPAGVSSSAGMPHALAWVRRRRSSVIRSGVRATSMPPLSVNTPSSLYCSVESLVSSNIIFEYSIGKMKFDACPVDPPGFGSGPLSTSTTSRQPSSARWCTRLLPTMPAPITTALARDGTSVMALVPFANRVSGAVARGPRKSGVMGHRPSVRHEFGERGLQAAESRVDAGKREAEEVRDTGRRRFEPGGRLLGEPDDPAVVAEVVVPQLRVPVQAEAGEHGAVERAHQVVGKQVRARLVREQPADPVRAREHVIAVQARQARHAAAPAESVERPVGATVGVGHHGAGT